MKITTTKKIGLLFCTMTLSACGVMNPDGKANYYAPYSFGQSQQTATSPLYPDGYDSTSGGEPYYTRERVLTVPESYHVGSEHSPASFQDRERSWVGRQSPQNYTIELGDSEKASQVASTLQKAPKDARKAEIKYNRGDKKYYKGVYGTYSSYESAQKALNDLPDDLKTNASVKTWGSVQNSTGE